MPHNATNFEVTTADAGRRLDVVLGERLGLSRAQVRRLLEGPGVTLNDRPGPGKGVLLAAADRIAITGVTHGRDAAPTPQPELPLAVVASGDGWLVVDKPAGMPVHPLRPDETGTLLNAVAARYPQVVGVGEAGLRSGVVHRLDVDTSGVLLVAVTQPAWQRLRAAFADRRITKRYLAIVHGQLRGEREVSLQLTVGRHKPAKVKVVDASHPDRGARRCNLRWRSLEVADDATLVEVDLGTGFLHQIRVMLAHLGHPLVGDALYGGRPIAGAERPMLHAHRLAFEEVVGEAPPPPDFTAVWQALRGDQPLP